MRDILLGPAWKNRLSRIVRQLGSLKLAVVLLVVLATVIAAATIVEAEYGRTHAQWFIYHSGWFMGLLTLLGVNILCAALARWPWKRHQTGFVVTHGGLLVLLAGSIQTFVSGVEGQVVVAEGDSTDRMILPDRSQITAAWIGRPEEPPYEFSFVGGPVSWRKGATLDLGEIDGVRARVLRYLAHAKPIESWIADESATGGPLVRFEVRGPQDKAGLEAFLTDQDYGDEVLVGPIRVQLRRAANDAILGDFADPPTELGEKGVLVAYFKDHIERIPIDDNVGKSVALGDTGATVEIVEYMANAKPESHGRFRSFGDQPKNPLLELQVRVENEKEPFRQLAFASSPLLNLDGVYGRDCPVRFHYHHPAMMKKSSAIEFLQTSDGALHCRVFTGESFSSAGQVKAGSRIEGPGNFTFTITEHLAHARRKIEFEPVEVSAGQKAKPAAAAEIEITTAGVTQKVWLQRNTPSYASRTIITPSGPLGVQFGQAQAPLGFLLGLKDFRRDTNPGRAGNAAFASVVRLMDVHHGLDEERVISMNEPLTHNRLTFYQSGFNEVGHGVEASTLSVAYDPGRTLKYAGSLLICLGIAIMFYMRAYFFKSVPRMRSERVEPLGNPEAPLAVGDADDSLLKAG